MDASLTHLPKRKQDDLARLVPVVREFVGDALQMIVLYGSYARGDWKEDRDLSANRPSGHASDYDILLITSTPQAARDIESDADLDRQAAKLDLSAHPRFIAYGLNAFNKNLLDGRFFYVDIFRQGKLLYDTGQARLVDPKILSAQERYDIAKEYFDQWFTRARDHFQASVLLAQQQLDLDAVFLLHQAAESALKTILLLFTHYSPDEHWLKNLMKLAAKYDAELPSTLPQHTAEEKRLFKLLDTAYIGARYDKNYKITREELDYLAARVKQLLDRVQAVCMEHLAQLKNQKD